MQLMLDTTVQFLFHIFFFEAVFHYGIQAGFELSL